MVPLGHYFGTPGHHFGHPGIPRDTQWDPVGSRLGFFVIFGGFGVLLGIKFGVSLVTFSCFGLPKSRYGFQGSFFSDLGVEIHQDPMLGCA